MFICHKSTFVAGKSITCTQVSQSIDKHLVD